VSVRVLEVDTPFGPARAHVRTPAAPLSRDRGIRDTGTVVLGHGAGGGIDAADLVAVAAEAVRAGHRAVLVEQPWRVAGGRVAPAPPRLDVGWLAVLALLDQEGLLTGPLVVGGRSAGARVACRTARRVGARAVLALAFPLHPPGAADVPGRSRAGELITAGVPVVAVQGRRDPFGTPAELEALAVPGLEIVAVDGGHELTVPARRGPVSPGVAGAVLVAFGTAFGISTGCAALDPDVG